MNRRIIRSFAVVASLSMLFAFAIPGQAKSDGCLPTPELSASRLVDSKVLANGVTAKAWQWYAGNDAGLAGLSQLGTRVSVTTGNLRNIDFGILSWPITQTADLRQLSYQDYQAIASINGDYMDGNGPYSAMIEDSEMFYAPSGLTQVLGMVKSKVDPTKGYRATGRVTVGSKIIVLTGVNQLKLSKDSAVIYQSNFIHPVTPKGDATFVFRAGKLVRVYPRGAAVSTKLGLVVQVSGTQVTKVRSMIAKGKVKYTLSAPPNYETRMAADQISALGTISNATTTLSFDSLNSNVLSAGATLFDDSFAGTTNSGQVALRIGPDSQGRLVVKNVYDHGYYAKVDPGSFMVQANRSAAKVALKFKVNDVVTITRSYRSSANVNYINAIGRGPRLIQNGKFTWVCSQHAKDFRPRTAVGWNDDGQVWFITSSRGEDAADLGMRQGGSSTDQMGHWLLALGATEGYLLDGGGSTTMEINIPNSGWKRFDLPDSAWYRGLANGLALKLKN